MAQLNGKQIKKRSIRPDRFKEMPWKDKVRAASTGNLNLASMPASVDGIALSSGDRFLVKDQTSQPENGIYVFNGAAAAATRATDADTTAELNRAVVGVVEGNDNEGTTWEQLTANPTVGVSNVVWAPFGTDLEEGDGIVFVGKKITVQEGDDSIEVGPAGVKAAVPYTGNKEMDPLDSSGDYSATGLTLDRTPAGDGYAQVGVNGHLQDVADGDRDAAACYFSDDAGATAKDLCDLAEGDELYWNEDIADWELEQGEDRVSFFYNVVQACNSSSSSY